MKDTVEEEAYDYGEFAEEDFSGTDLERLLKLMEQQLAVEAYVDVCKVRLDEAEKAFNKLKFFTVPDLMDKLGIAEHKTVDGKELKMSEVLRGSIPEANLPKALDWLDSNGHEKLIKRTITIDFGKGDEAWAKKFERDCAKRKKPLNLKRKRGVHPQTLQAFVRGQLEEGVDFPMDLFGVFRQRFAKVKLPKEQ